MWYPPRTNTAKSTTWSYKNALILLQCRDVYQCFLFLSLLSISLSSFTKAFLPPAYSSRLWWLDTTANLQRPVANDQCFENHEDPRPGFDSEIGNRWRYQVVVVWGAPFFFGNSRQGETSHINYRVWWWLGRDDVFQWLPWYHKKIIISCSSSIDQHHVPWRTWHWRPYVQCCKHIECPQWLGARKAKTTRNRFFPEKANVEAFPGGIWISKVSE